MDYQSPLPNERVSHSGTENGDCKTSLTDNNNISPEESDDFIARKGGDCEISTTNRLQQERNLTNNENNHIPDKDNIRIGSGEGHISNSSRDPEADTSDDVVTNTNNQMQQESEQQRQTQSQTPQPVANNRSILILREIDPNVSKSLVMEIFDSENCPTRPVHCEHALQNSWYVTFKSDDDARSALAYIRRHVVTWNGHPIMARYKPKPAVPSTPNQPLPLHHHHQQQQHIVPTMVIHQHIGRVSQAPTTSTIATATTPTQQATSNRDAAGHNENLSDRNQEHVVSMTRPFAHHHHQHHNPVATLESQQQSLIAHQHTTSYGIPSASSPMVQVGANPARLMHQMHGTLQNYGYSSVAYYNQNGPVMAPWHYGNGPQYDLSEIFVYNGLAPYSPLVKSEDLKSGISSQATTVSSATLLAAPAASIAQTISSTSVEAPIPYHSNRQHQHNHRNNPQQHLGQQFPPIHHIENNRSYNNSNANDLQSYNVPHQQHAKSTTNQKGNHKPNRHK